jgi:hypothetical protein
LYSQKERDHSEDRNVDGRITKIQLRKTGLESVDWIHVVEDMDQLRALVNTLMNLRVL